MAYVAGLATHNGRNIGHADVIIWAFEESVAEDVKIADEAAAIVMSNLAEHVSITSEGWRFHFPLRCTVSHHPNSKSEIVHLCARKTFTC